MYKLYIYVDTKETVLTVYYILKRRYLPLYILIRYGIYRYIYSTKSTNIYPCL